MEQEVELLVTGIVVFLLVPGKKILGVHLLGLVLLMALHQYQTSVIYTEVVVLVVKAIYVIQINPGLLMKI